MPRRIRVITTLSYLRTRAGLALLYAWPYIFRTSFRIDLFSNRSTSFRWFLRGKIDAAPPIYTSSGIRPTNSEKFPRSIFPDMRDEIAVSSPKTLKRPTGYVRFRPRFGALNLLNAVDECAPRLLSSAYSVSRMNRPVSSIRLNRYFYRLSFPVNVFYSGDNVYATLPKLSRR